MHLKSSLQQDRVDMYICGCLFVCSINNFNLGSTKDSVMIFVSTVHIKKALISVHGDSMIHYVRKERSHFKVAKGLLTFYAADITIFFRWKYKKRNCYDENRSKVRVIAAILRHILAFLAFLLSFNYKTLQITSYIPQQLHFRWPSEAEIELSIL